VTTHMLAEIAEQPTALRSTIEALLPRAAEAVGAENLCRQAIFMNHASNAVAPEDAEVVQVGDAIGQRAERRGLVQGAVPVLLFGCESGITCLLPFSPGRVAEDVLGYRNRCGAAAVTGGVRSR
jgi:hypothetical protein